MRRRAGSTNVIPFDRDGRRPYAARAHEFAETARRLEREREEAAGRVERLLRETPREEWPRLAEHRALHDCGALERLSAEVSSRLPSAPRDALAISAIAVSIAETLHRDAYPAVIRAQIRATAWKDRAQALSHVGRDAEALDAARRAESMLEGFGSVAHDRAIVRLVKATILLELGRDGECLQLLRECRSVFRDHGDDRRQLDCGMREGDLLFGRAADADARRVYSSLVEVARTVADFAALSRLHDGIGHCSARLGETALAAMHFAAAKRRS
jgi:hypothetical protein